VIIPNDADRSPMLLLTGANGRTGRAILSSLVARDVQVRAFVRNPAHADDLLALGAAQIAVGDMASAIDAATAVGGCSTSARRWPRTKST